MPTPLTFEKVLSSCNKNPAIAYIDTTPIYKDQWLFDIQYLIKKFKDRNQKSWALYTEDTYKFSIALFALLIMKKNVVIPGNKTRETCLRLKKQSLAFIGDFDDDCEDIPCLNQKISTSAIQFTIDSLETNIIIFTSGSTGEPKPIKKTLFQFEMEAHQIKKTAEAFNWPSPYKAIYFSTVNHQHLYGMTFSMLWPILIEQPFYSRKIPGSHWLFNQLNYFTMPAIWVTSPAHLKRLPCKLTWQYAEKGLRMIFSSGGPLPEKAAKHILDNFRDAPYEIFGSSETGAIAFRQQCKGQDRWSPFIGVEITTGKENRLRLKSHNLTTRICNIEQVENNTCELEDIIELFDNGTFLLKGRMDRIIKVEEKRLSLVELEISLKASSFIEDAYVTPIDCHRFYNEKRQILSAVIVPTSTGQLTLHKLGRKHLINTLRRELSTIFEPVAIPKKWRFIKHIPYNEQGKIEKYLIDSLFK